MCWEEVLYTLTNMPINPANQLIHRLTQWLALLKRCFKLRNCLGSFSWYRRGFWQNLDWSNKLSAGQTWSSTSLWQMDRLHAEQQIWPYGGDHAGRECQGLSARWHFISSTVESDRGLTAMGSKWGWVLLNWIFRWYWYHHQWQIPKHSFWSTTKCVKRLENWLNSTKLSANPNKTSILPFTRLRNKRY